MRVQYVFTNLMHRNELLTLHSDKQLIEVLYYDDNSGYLVFRLPE